MNLDYISHMDWPNYFLDEDNVVFAVPPWLDCFLIENKRPYSFMINNKTFGSGIKIL